MSIFGVKPAQQTNQQVNQQQTTNQQQVNQQQTTNQQQVNQQQVNQHQSQPQQVEPVQAVQPVKPVCDASLIKDMASRIDCGVSPEGPCIKAGCCWSPSYTNDPNRPGNQYPWCYRPQPKK